MMRSSLRTSRKRPNMEKMNLALRKMTNKMRRNLTSMKKPTPNRLQV